MNKTIAPEQHGDYLEKHRRQLIQEQRNREMENLGYYCIDENGDLTPEGKINQLKNNLNNMTIDILTHRFVDYLILSAVLTFILS